MSCPLCGVWDRESEGVLWQNKYFALVRTKNLKGHKERIMLVSKKHTKVNHDMRGVLQASLPFIMKAFDYTYKVIVLDGKFGSIPDHWHLCITDIEEGSDDHQQILGTPWLFTIPIKEWKK